MLQDYNYQFVENCAKNPSTKNFNGIHNPQLISEIEKFKADAVLIFGWKFRSHLKAMKYFKGKIPVLFRGDSTLLDEQATPKTILRRFILKNVYRYIDYALYVGTENKKYFLAHGLSEKQLIFAPHAIDNQRFSSDNEKRRKQAADKRLELGILPNDTVYLFVGKFEPKKAPTDIIKIAQRIKQKNIKFLFVGNGPLEQQMKTQAPDNCFFLDFQNQSQMPVIYRMGDALILPSHGPGETWGLAVNEAMACGIPVLASNKVGCSTDLVKENHTGFKFEAGNIHYLLQLIEKNDKPILCILGKNAQAFISNWHFGKICSAIENIVNIN